MVNQGEAEIWMSRITSNEILNLYLRKRQVYVHLTWINDFSGPEIQAVRIGGQACINV